MTRRRTFHTQLSFRAQRETPSTILERSLPMKMEMPLSWRNAHSIEPPQGFLTLRGFEMTQFGIVHLLLSFRAQREIPTTIL
jgi:hypothetical protein